LDYSAGWNQPGELDVLDVEELLELLHEPLRRARALHREDDVHGVGCAPIDRAETDERVAASYGHAEHPQ
jgi:hypothetical protein